MRTTLAVILVLQSFLAEPSPSELYGYRIRQLTNLGAATVSNVLRRLLEEELIEESPGPPISDPQGPQRKYYRLTTDGRQRAARLVNSELDALAPLFQGPGMAPIPRPAGTT